MKSIATGLGTAFPETSYTQLELEKIFNVTNPIVKKFMNAGHIQKRHLYLKEIDPNTGIIKNETPKELREKFIAGIKDIGVKAAIKAIQNSNVSIDSIKNIIAVTSTGFIVPGVSTILAKELGLREDLHRQDIVGMGCNAGMSALYSASNSVIANTNTNTLVVCVEINSAAYVLDNTIGTGLVNSLFGDGASAVVIEKSKRVQNIINRRNQNSFEIIDFETYNITDQSDAMRFELDERENKQRFFLSKDIPFVIGENMKIPINKLLTRNNLEISNIDHIVMHTGGDAVINGAIKSIGINDYDVRHTRSVLRDYGNISSGSFLVSLERLYAEESLSKGDKGLLIAMGPGSTIESALIKFL